MTPQSSCCKSCLCRELILGNLIVRCRNFSCPCHKADTAEKCLCACHTNTLEKPYEHDTECCKKMNGTPAEKCQPVEATHAEVQDALKHSVPWTCIVGNSVESCGGILEPDETGWEERLTELWNEHDGTHFYKDEFKELIKAEKEKSLAEGIERGRREERKANADLQKRAK